MRDGLLLTLLVLGLLAAFVVAREARCEDCPLLCQVDQDCCSGVCVMPKGGTWGNCE